MGHKGLFIAVLLLAAPLLPEEVGLGDVGVALEAADRLNDVGRSRPIWR